MPDTAPSTPFGFESLLRGVLDVLQHAPLPLLLPLVALSLITSARGTGQGFNVDISGGSPLLLMPFFSFLGVIAFLVLIVILFIHAILWLVTGRAAGRAFDRDSVDIQESFRDIKPLLSGGILTFFGFALVALVGFMLFVVPGIFVLGALAPWVGVVIHEKKTGIEALKRAWELTEGHRLVLFLISLAGFVASIGAGLLLNWVPLIGPALVGIINGALIAAYIVLGIVFYKRRVAEAAPAVSVPAAQ